MVPVENGPQNELRLPSPPTKRKIYHLSCSICSNEVFDLADPSSRDESNDGMAHY